MPNQIDKNPSMISSADTKLIGDLDFANQPPGQQIANPTSFPPEVAIVGCGWLGFAVAQRLIQLGHRVAGSTTSPQKLSELRTIGVDSALLRLDPPRTVLAEPEVAENLKGHESKLVPPAPTRSTSESGIESAPLKRLFSADVLMITVPPSGFDDEIEYVEILRELVNRWKPDCLKGPRFQRKNDAPLMPVAPREANPDAYQNAHLNPHSGTPPEAGRSPQLIFVSSTSVYGDVSGIITEETEANPATVSGRLMRAGEIALTELARQRKVSSSSSSDSKQPTPSPTAFAFRLTVLRSGGQIGFGRHPGRFLADKTNVADPDAPVNLIHQADLAECVVQLALQNQTNDVEIFNAVSDQHPTRRDFYEAASRTIQLTPPQFRAQDPKSLPGKIVSSEKIRKNLVIEMKFDDLMAIATGKQS